MVAAADEFRTATPGGSDAAQRTRPSGWVLRAVVTVHLIAIFGQPVFAGVFLSGDYDGLRMHRTGADLTTTLGYTQLAAAAAVWLRLRRPGPFAATCALVAAETVQYVAGTSGALWLHLPLGVATIAALVVQFVGVWRRPLARRAKAPAAPRGPVAGQSGPVAGHGGPVAGQGGAGAPGGAR